MEKRKKWKKSLLTILLTVSMTMDVFSSSAVASGLSGKKSSSEDPVYTETDDSTKDQTNTLSSDTVDGTNAVAPDQESEVDQDKPDPDEDVRVFIVFDKKSVTDSGYSTDDISDNAAAMKLRDKIEKDQDKKVKEISKEALDGEKLDVSYNFTLLTNAVSADVKYSDVKDIEKVDGVEAVYRVPTYNVEETAEPKTITAGDMIGSYSVWGNGYTGAGRRIAVIDTGIDSDHPSFDGGAFDYSLKETAEKNGKTVSDYDLLTKEELSKDLPNLNALKRDSSLTADNAYLSDKIPFAFNYVDKNLDVTHDNDTEGDHGTHVSGISLANKYVPDKASATGYSKQESGVAGVAPDAQLMTMKVFGKAGGAYSDDYMAAIEDALIMKADAINLSLGSSSAGNSTDSEAYINDIFDKLQGTDTVVSISAGNAGRWSDNSSSKANMAEDVNMDTVGSPGSYTNALTVASAVNSGYTGYSVMTDGTALSYYQDGSDSKAPAFKTLDTSKDRSGTDYDYVFLTGKGETSDYKDVDVKGKIVFVSRGAITFGEKQMNAEAAGAIACFVYNNTSGTIGMTLKGSTAVIPCASITQADAEAVKAGAVKVSDQVYTGKIKVNGKVSTKRNVHDGYTMSDFSSVGVPGDLKLKPEITAPGGNIYSTLNNGQYGLMSGTSMAAPSVSGMSALVAQYIKDKGLDKKTGLPVRTLSQSLLMSTAETLKDKDGNIYSPRAQGAGLGNVYNAVTTPVYVLMNGQDKNDGKVKAELGDDPDKKGVYSFSMDLCNLSDEPQYYYADSDILTEKLFDGGYIKNVSYKLSPKVDIKSSDEANIYDLDDNGKVNKADAKLLLKYVNGTKKLNQVTACEDDFDFNKDGAVNTADVYDYLDLLHHDKDKLDKTAIKVEDKTTIDVTVTLSDKDKDYLSKFSNGMYVDGFIKLDGGVDLSVPMLAFYGNWADSSMYENYNFMEAKTDKEYAKNVTTYTGVDPTNYMTFSFGGDNSKYFYVPNLYATDDKYNPDRNAFTSGNGDKLVNFNYSLIRNASRVAVIISNAETGEEYFKTEKDDNYAAFWYDSNADWEEKLSSIDMNWEGTDAKGNPLPEGTKVNVTLKAVPSYYDGKDLSEIKGNGLEITYPMTIDNSAPEIVGMKDTSDSKLELTLKDNRYTAAALVIDHDKKTILNRYAINQAEAGKETTLTIDYPKTVFYVRVFDYAGNYKTYRVNKSGIPDTEIVDSISLDKQNLAMSLGDEYQLTTTVAPISLLDDTVTYSSSDEKVATVSKDGKIDALKTGTAVITATTKALDKDGKAETATCEVTVSAPSIGLTGAYAAPDGTTDWASINTNDIKTISIKGKSDQMYLSAADTGKGIVAVNKNASGKSDLFKIDQSTYASQKIASLPIMTSDLTYSEDNGYLYGVYGPYLAIFNPDTGALTGAYDMSKELGNDYLVGIAELAGSQYSGTPCDYLYGISKAGNLYQILSVPGMGYGIDKLGSTGVDNGGLINLSSLYYDPTSDYLVLSSYNGKTDKNEAYVIKDIYDKVSKTDTIKTFDIGSLPDGSALLGIYKEASANAEASVVSNSGDKYDNIQFKKSGYVSKFKEIEE
jgi:lactocepin